MLVSDMPFGHSASHAPVLVHAPNPSASICATIRSARSLASGAPWGSNANWDTLALTNNMAEEFLQAATHAPQPMQVAASNASSATFLGMGISLASGTPPVLTETYPPAC